MSQNLETLYVEIKAKSDDLEKQLDEIRRKANSSASSATEGFKGMFKGIAAIFAIDQTLDFIGDSIKESLEAAKAFAQVEQAIKATGAAAGFSSIELKKMAGDLEEAVAVDADSILKDVSLQMLTFGNISGDVFKKAQVAVMDLSATLGSDLKGQTIQLGKALDNPLKGMAALSKSGIMFSEVQKEQIKNYVKAGNLTAAQNVILDEINSKYGGQAKAMAGATNGVQQAQIAWGNLKEEIGNLFGPLLSEWLPQVVNGIKGWIILINKLRGIEEKTDYEEFKLNYYKTVSKYTKEQYEWTKLDLEQQIKLGQAVNARLLGELQIAKAKQASLGIFGIFSSQEKDAQKAFDEQLKKFNSLQAMYDSITKDAARYENQLEIQTGNGLVGDDDKAKDKFAVETELSKIASKQITDTYQKTQADINQTYLEDIDKYKKALAEKSLSDADYKRLTIARAKQKNTELADAERQHNVDLLQSKLQADLTIADMQSKTELEKLEIIKKSLLEERKYYKDGEDQVAEVNARILENYANTEKAKRDEYTKTLEHIYKLKELELELTGNDSEVKILGLQKAKLTEEKSNVNTTDSRKKEIDQEIDVLDKQTEIARRDAKLNVQREYYDLVKFLDTDYYAWKQGQIDLEYEKNIENGLNEIQATAAKNEALKALDEQRFQALLAQNEGLNALYNGITSGLENAASQGANAFADILVDGFTDAKIRIDDIMKNIVSSIINELAKIAIKKAAMGIINLATGGLGGIISGIGSLLGFHDGGEAIGTNKGVMKLATGGSFTVPQGYPNDSFPMMVESGERVSVTPAGKVTNNDYLLIHKLDQVNNSIQAMNINLMKKDMNVTVNSELDALTFYQETMNAARIALQRNGVNLNG